MRRKMQEINKLTIKSWFYRSLVNLFHFDRVREEIICIFISAVTAVDILHWGSTWSWIVVVASLFPHTRWYREIPKMHQDETRNRLHLDERIIHNILKNGNILPMRNSIVFDVLKCKQNIRSVRFVSCGWISSRPANFHRFLALIYVVRPVRHVEHGLTLYADFNSAQVTSLTFSHTKRV